MVPTHGYWELISKQMLFNLHYINMIEDPCCGDSSFLFFLILDGKVYRLGTKAYFLLKYCDFRYVTTFYKNYLRIFKTKRLSYVGLS